MAGGSGKARRWAGAAMCALWAALLVWPWSPGPVRAQVAPASHASVAFRASQECMACHNGLTTPAGEDVSIGASWRASMMAHSSRDPYWQGAVRREAADHPEHAEAIEDECSICHMPMTTYTARSEGRLGRIFGHLPIDSADDQDKLAADGVSCTVCHQITAERLGSRESFTGGYVLSVASSSADQPMFGPFQVERGRAQVMRSSTGMSPAESTHIQQSEICATCHTLFTQALESGKPVGTLPEQVPFLEWQHSAYREERSCQSCHMPVVTQPTRIASVVADPREGLSRHSFLGGNAFMLRMLNRFRQDLGVTAPAQELEASARATERQLREDTASVSVERPSRTSGGIAFVVSVENRAGHKFPTGYPSRRAWLHVTVRNLAGGILFESGAITPAGQITGNDHDADRVRVEPHYEEIRSADQVQIYESTMVDVRGVPTTGLLTGVRYVKDNRLLPRGFDKGAASDDVAVRGTAVSDDDFVGGADQVRYVLNQPGLEGSVRIEVELRFQTIAYRWARNLGDYQTPETQRFVSYYDAMAEGSAVVVARASATIP